MKQQKWDSNDIPDQKGRVAIVTGSSSGVGYETARVLAEKNAIVIIAVRNLQKGNADAEKIRGLHPGGVHTEFGEVVAEQLNDVPSDTAYAKRYEKLGDFFKKNKHLGSKPEVLAQTISKAIKAKNPKTRYMSSLGVRPALILRRLLSDKMIDRLLKRMFSID